MWLLAKMECYRLFVTPLAWVIMALVQLLLAYLFLRHIDGFGQIQGQIAAIPGAPGVTQLIITPLLNNIALVLLLITPLLMMRSFAEERRNNSLSLLISSPLSLTQIVLGKYIGMLLFYGVLLLMLLMMPLSLKIGSQIDFYHLAAGIVGLVLLASSFIAIGLFISSLTAQPAIAAAGSFCLLLLLWLLDWTSQTHLMETNVFSWLSLFNHYEAMLSGQLYTADIAYYLIITVSFLIITIRQLDYARVSQ